MNEFCISILSDFDSEIANLKCSSLDIITLTNKIIDWLEAKINELHKLLKKYKFGTSHEEIQFFKALKPILVSKLIFHKKVLELETNEPASKKMKIKFYEKELSKIHQYSKNNKEFYQYYRSKACHKDTVYFIRNNPEKQTNDCYLINYDSRLWTSHDYKTATIVANNLLSVYLEEKIEFTNQSSNLIHPDLKSKLNWTGNKIDLVELIYALHHQKVINGGNTDIKEIAIQVGKTFNVELEENIYRWYLDIKNRKNVKTKFLETISENFNNKISEEEH